MSKLQRFWSVIPRVILWRVISAAKIDAFHAIPGLPYRMSLEPKFRGVGSLGVFSLGRRYEPILEHLTKLVSSGAVCIDCGANQGVYALYLATIVGHGGRVFAVEPQSYASRRIALSALYNELHNITVIEAAVSDVSGVSDFHIFDEPVSAGLHKSGGRIVPVPTVTIDQIAKSYGVEKVYLIKLDVEGAELRALKGAGYVISRDKPLIMFELLDDPYADQPSSLWSEFRLLGYRIYSFRDNRLVDVTEARAQAFDLLAVHEDDESRIVDFNRAVERCAAPAPAEKQTATSA